MTCDYAACREPATTRAGGWVFCSKHAEDDRKIRAGEDDTLDGEPLTPDLLPPEASGHGTEWRAQKHRRDGEPPCAACLAAEARAKVDRRSRTVTIPQPSPLARLLPLVLDQAQPGPLVIDDESLPWPGPLTCSAFGALTALAVAAVWLWNLTRPPRRRR